MGNWNPREKLAECPPECRIEELVYSKEAKLLLQAVPKKAANTLSTKITQLIEQFTFEDQFEGDENEDAEIET